jgi:coenzyme F420-reducing hydrogenase beta subunit
MVGECLECGEKRERGQTMITRLDPLDCTGCMACAQKCPARCIAVIWDEEGFLRPQIDAERCTRCDLCEKACPQLTPCPLNAPLKAYAARVTDGELLKNSTSGGVFTLLARRTVQRGGVVFGAAMDADGLVKTVAVTDADGLFSLQGSKYVQSDTHEAFAQAKACLDEGRRVLFSGTPCQVAGLRGYLGKPNPALATVDLVCHGVPSPRLFSAYRSWLEKKHRDRIIRWRFRSMERPGRGSVDRIDFRHKTIYQREVSSPYGNAFLKSLCLRESCYRCPYARPERAGDVTLGDYWGVTRYHPDFDAASGASLVLANTPAGNAMLEEAMDELYVSPSHLEWMQTWNGALVQCAARPPQRRTLYRNLAQKPLSRFVKEDLKVSQPLQERLKAAVPYRLKKSLKKGLKRLLAARRAPRPTGGSRT